MISSGLIKRKIADPVRNENRQTIQEKIAEDDCTREKKRLQYRRVANESFHPLHILSERET